jgi:hypothetical protein
LLLSLRPRFSNSFNLCSFCRVRSSSIPVKSN